MSIRKPKRRPENISSSKDLFIENIEEIISIPFTSIVPNKNNPYPIVEVDELVDSIKQFGLEQNLVVKKIAPDEYEIFSGHKRYEAIKKILDSDEDNEYEHLTNINVKVIPQEENEIISHLRKHDTNLQARNLLKLEEEQKLAIIDDYMYWIEQARKENILINNKPIKGKTRDIIAERFNISPRTAQDLISEVKNKGKESNISSVLEEEKIPEETKQYNGIVKKLNTLSKAIDNADSITYEQKEDIRSQIKTILDNL